MALKLTLLILNLLMISSSAWTSNNRANTVCVILVTPENDNSYYSSVYDNVIKFQANYAKQISDHGEDSVVIVTDSVGRNNLKSHGVPDDVIVIPSGAPVKDIWVRDFGLVGIDQQLAYIYEPDYLGPGGRRLAKRIQNSLLNFFKSIGITPKGTPDLVLDGGNVVDNGIDGAFFTERIYKDGYNLGSSNAGKTAIRNILSNSLGYSKIMVLKEVAGDTTGHSDGMVSFLDDDVVGISDLPSAEYNPIESLVLNNGYTPVYLNSSYKDEVWEGFGSACGLHVNLLATPSTLYVPTFGGDPKNRENGRLQSLAKDAEVVGVIDANSNKDVVQIAVPWDVCKMGGSVRCLSMSLSGQNANKMINAAQNN